MNPILQQLSGQNSGVSRAVQMYHAYQAAQNPALAMQQILNQNPMLNQIRQLNGGNLQQTFYAMCQSQGVDPQTILSQFS